MSKHTPGRLSVDEYPVTLANGDLAHAKLSIVAPSKDPRYLHFSIGMVNFSAEFTGLFSSDIEEAEANARRLVACWNACEGISTDNLENNQPVKWLAQQYNNAIKQRDELMEALRELLVDVSISQANMRDAAKRDQRWEGCAEAIQPRVDAAHAVIAKATGEPQ